MIGPPIGVGPGASAQASPCIKAAFHDRSQRPPREGGTSSHGPEVPPTCPIFILFFFIFF